MKPAPVVIRACAEADVAAVQAIYAHHVLHGTATFEEDPPAVAEMARRRAEVLALGLPWLVAAAEERVVGYAYAGVYRTRSAYRHTVEDSLYLAPGWGGRGVGSALLGELIAGCAAAGRRQIVAVIGDSANVASVRLHARHGFAMVGTLRAVGWKFGRWLDTVIMQRELTPP